MSRNMGKAVTNVAAIFSSSSDAGRLARRFVALAVLVAGMFYVLAEPPRADAAPCCQTCLQEQAACENACAEQCGGTANTCYTACWDDCYDGFIYCGGRCVWCGSGGGGGGGGSVFSCNFSWPTPDGYGGWYNSVDCSNGYAASCYHTGTGSYYCCDVYGCYPV